jgi:hypothetical protein
MDLLNQAHQELGSVPNWTRGLTGYARQKRRMQLNSETMIPQLARRGASGTQRNSPNPDASRRRFERLRDEIAPLRAALLNHPIYAEVDSLSRLREFMQIHVFAVWDFMSLVKRLQGELTSNSLPWLPPLRSRIARFANEVVLGEESDLGLDGKPISHFELYLRAMDEIGADTTLIRGFMAQMGLGEQYDKVFTEIVAPPGVVNFVNETLRCAIHASVVEVASFFFFGREDVIPEMFQRLLRLWGNAKTEVPHFAFYLERHIELDGDSHGPWAQEMLTALAGESESNWKQATSAAEQAITSRIRLWDQTLAHLKVTERGNKRRLLPRNVA